MKSIFKMISIIIAVILAILGVMFVLDLVGGPETKDLAIKSLEIGGILLILSLIVMFVTKSNK